MKRLGHLLLVPIRLEPGEEWQNQSEGWSFLHLSRGAAYWLGPQANRAWTAGEVAIVPPLEPGTVRASQLGEVLLHGFALNPGLLCGFLTLEECHYFEPAAGSARREVRFLSPSHAAALRFRALAALDHAPATVTRRVEVLGIVADVLQGALALPPPAATLSTAVIHRFRELVAQMPGLELIDHSPAELAARCGCGLRHFHRLFRQQVGVAFRTQQAHLRLLKGQQLLFQTNEPVLEIARRCGYDHSSPFCTLFRRKFGLTPSAWRHQVTR